MINLNARDDARRRSLAFAIAALIEDARRLHAAHMIIPRPANEALLITIILG
jgi:hypothetical protein